MEKPITKESRNRNDRGETTVRIKLINSRARATVWVREEKIIPRIITAAAERITSSR